MRVAAKEWRLKSDKGNGGRNREEMKKKTWREKEEREGREG